MAEEARRYPPAHDLVYSEADVAIMRERWEQTSKDQQYQQQLAQLTGELRAFSTSLPHQVEGIARRVVLEVLNEQRERLGQQAVTGLNLASQVTQAMTAVGVLFLALKAAGFPV